MKKFLKIVLLIVTFLSLISMIFAFELIFYAIFPSPIQHFFKTNLGNIFGLLSLLNGFLGVILYTTYIIIFVKCKPVPKEKIFGWMIAVLLGGQIGMIFFWYFYLWKPGTK